MSRTTTLFSFGESVHASRAPRAFTFSPLRRLLWRVVCATAVCAIAPQAEAQAPPDVDRSASNLMVVLRESSGQNKQDEALKPMGKSKVKLPSGETVEIDTGWFEYLGDMHIRFVFDGPNMMANATPEDLQRLQLSPDAALRLAVGNIKRVYGKPKVAPFSGGLMDVSGKSPDLNSSYFLDREFWEALNKQYPEGLVAAPIKRGGLLYAPLADAKAVEALRKGVGSLFQSSGRMRVSSALYLFKDGQWRVFQAPLKSTS